MANKQIDVEQIEIEGIETNNLKIKSIKIPLYQLTSVTGVSGSGKSSLVFDTLYAEAYRRYVESLSSFARQYLKALPKPKITSIKNLPPAIAVQQSRSGASNRSTVGTLTELHDILRIVYALTGQIVCVKCKKPVEKADPDRMAIQILSDSHSRRIMMAAPTSALDGVSDKDFRTLLQAQGFSRIWTDGKLERLEDLKKLDRAKAWVVVDRLTVAEDSQKRLVEASGLALKLGRGRAAVIDESSHVQEFSTALECCGSRYVEPTLPLFSFNHPIGACGTCQGFGSSTVLDESKIIPDLELSLHEHGVVCWNFGEHTSCYKDAQKSATSIKMDIFKKKFSRYTQDEKKWLWSGDQKNFSGIKGYFEWLDTKRYKPHYRIHAARFRKYIVCPECHGQRLNEKVRAIQVLGLGIQETADLNIKHLDDWFARLEASGVQAIAGRDSSGQGVEEAIEEARARLGYLIKMGLSYLSLSRSAKTLSGGELQRINMSRCLGSVLTETLFCLDEPTTGLHPRDSENLLDVIYELRDQGNTVVVVEHEKTIIQGSDHFIEIGPKAGNEGGLVTYEGTPTKKSRETQPQTPTPSTHHDQGKASFIEIKGASIHNLKNIDVRFPAGKLVAVCGVSGSGKTSLIKQTLYPLLAQKFAKLSGDKIDDLPADCTGSVGPDKVINLFSAVDLVSQVAIGRSSRSTIATYLDVMDHIRKILVSQDLSKRLKLTPGSFSFNSPGGRCETCRGLGTVSEDLSFLGEMDIICPSCNGLRFQESVLSVTYRGKNLIEILGMTAQEARTFFYDHRQIVASLDAVIGVGMGYVTLGQGTSSFSGGEAQRLKLVQILRDAGKGKPSILIFDEPTTGLSDSDVAKLLVQFRQLTTIGHTVIVVEHHLDVLRSADWLIELGPEASEEGGSLVYSGVPEGLTSVNQSVTRRFLFN